MYIPVRLEILRSHAPCLNDSTLLRQIFLGKALSIHTRKSTFDREAIDVLRANRRTYYVVRSITINNFLSHELRKPFFLLVVA